MTVKTFFIGLAASFALPWLAMVAVPYAKMRAVETPQFVAEDGTETPYQPVKSGRVTDGSAIYGKEGCAMCHSQVSRPTYAGNDLGRDGLAGFVKDPELGNTMRETNLWDYDKEPYAWIGETRMGPDLGNFGRRMEMLAIAEDTKTAEKLGVKVDELTLDQKFDVTLAVYTHLYNPREDNEKSICPSNKGMFKVEPIYGTRSDVALPVKRDDNKQVLPDEEALTLASYLLGLKRDGEIPQSLNKGRAITKTAGK